MTDEQKSLVTRLKGHSEIMERDRGKLVRFIDVATCTEAVDLIEAQAAEIARLQEEVKDLMDELAYRGIYPNNLMDKTKQ